MTLPSEPLAPSDTNTDLVTVAAAQKGTHSGPTTRGKENMDARRNSNTEEAIDVVNVDASAEYGSETEQTEGGRPVRKRKAIAPFDEDTDMDTDDLLEQEVVKTKKKPAPRGKAKQTLNEDGTVKTPRKYTRKKTAFSDDDDSNGNMEHGPQYTGKPGVAAETIFSKFKRTPKARVPYVKPEDPLDFDPSYVYSLARQYPDNYWRSHAESKTGMINKISEDHPLTLVDNAHIHDQAPITGMVLSPDGTMLATFCNLGSVKIWSLEDFSLLKTLRDANEEHIDEFYVGTFTPDQTMVLVGGKLKDRNNWSEADEDNNILPCPLKIFDIVTGEVVTQLKGHGEELLCVKKVQFKGENYFLSGSQDGYLNKWHMESDWKTLKSMVQMADGVTCMAFTVSFVPNTGNKYFLAAADENLRLYDFEHATLLQTFENMYSSYCDCGKFIQPVDYPYPMPIPEESETVAPEEVSESSVKKGKMKAEPVAPVVKPQQFAYFISRGVELLDSEERMIAKDYNSCTLHKLVYPDTKGGKWYLTEVKRFQDEEYFSNAWLIKIASNGRYLMAPTCTGEVFIFNLKTGQVTGVLKDHDDVEVRDIIFHPTRPLLFTSADDGQVKVYSYKNPEDVDKALKDAATTEKKALEAAALISVATDLSAVSVKDEPEVFVDIIDEDLTE
ncbi:hypothetical protein BGZ74_008388 [Mortierella antarctica]|nr:hypothetical protein BGZ74_008388 [Mortierella antarctica]